jgi:hypothetical protein
MLVHHIFKGEPIVLYLPECSKNLKILFNSIRPILDFLQAFPDAEAVGGEVRLRRSRTKKVEEKK